MANRDAILSLRIFVQSTGATKTMRFASDMSVAEILREIADKGSVEGGRDHGLFSPPNKETGKKGFWLAKNRALRFYGIGSNVRLACPPSLALTEPSRRRSSTRRSTARSRSAWRTAR